MHFCCCEAVWRLSEEVIRKTQKSSRETTELDRTTYKKSSKTMTLKMDILVNEELLKTHLINYREICPVLLDIFIWKTDVYPCILTSIITIIFGTLYYTQPSIITTLAVIGLILTISDFVLPLLTKSITTQQDWTNEKEKKFSIFVNRITYYSVQLWNFTVTLDEWKTEKPNVYTSCVITSLLLIAWIGNSINNLLLAYLTVLFLALLPGLLHRRLLQKYISKTIVQIGHLLGIKGKKSN